MGLRDKLFGTGSRRSINAGVDQVEDGLAGAVRGLRGLRSGSAPPAQKQCPNCHQFSALSDPMCSNCRYRFE